MATLNSGVARMIPGQSGQPRLEARWMGSGTRVGVVAPPHPLMGGELSNPVVQAIAEGLGNGGLHCLLFNFRGVGESEGNPSGHAADADADYRAAITSAAALGSVVVAAGYSFGAATAIRVAMAEGIRVFAVAPPAALFSEHTLASAAAAVVLLAGGCDQIASADSLRQIVPGAARVRLETIATADHFFMRDLERVRELARQVALDAALG